MPELFRPLDPLPMPAGATPGAGLPDGDGRYASYHALWHLAAIGVVTDLLTMESAAWTAARDALAAAAPAGRRKKRPRPTRVALIDTSVAYEHPNLRPAIATDLMIDFFSARLGTFPRPGNRAVLEAALAGAGARKALLGGEAAVVALCAALEAHLLDEFAAAKAARWHDPGRVNPATSAVFSAHGTAMAGLIGARPRGDVAAVLTAHAGTGAVPQPLPPLEDLPSFPYAGVDPFCEIVPISTSFDPDPEQLILALIYARLIGSDIIVLARDFADPTASAITGEATPPDLVTEAEKRAILGLYPPSLGAEEKALWAALRKLVVALSREIPVVAATGNGGDETAILPAALADPKNGIIAVGAHAATRNRAGYSTAGPVTLYAPSGDGERLDAMVQRLDIADPEYRPGDHSAAYLDGLGLHYPPAAAGGGAGAAPGHAPLAAETAPGPSVFATQEIISTDVPGAAGYNGSPYSQHVFSGDAVLDYRSYYCRFSGTSAAAAITAGLLSLAMAAGAVPRGKGPQAKAALLARAKADGPGGAPRLHW